MKLKSYTEYKNIKNVINPKKFSIDISNILVDFLDEAEHSLDFTRHVDYKINDRFQKLTVKEVHIFCNFIVSLAIDEISKKWKHIKKNTLEKPKYQHLSIIVQIDKYFYKLIMEIGYEKSNVNFFDFRALTIITLLKDDFKLINPNTPEIIFKAKEKQEFDKEIFSQDLINRINESSRLYMEHPTSPPIENKNMKYKFYRIVEF